MPKPRFDRDPSAPGSRRRRMDPKARALTRACQRRGRHRRQPAPRTYLRRPRPRRASRLEPRERSRDEGGGGNLTTTPCTPSPPPRKHEDARAHLRSRWATCSRNLQSFLFTDLLVLPHLERPRLAAFLSEFFKTDCVWRGFGLFGNLGNGINLDTKEVDFFFFYRFGVSSLGKGEMLRLEAHGQVFNSWEGTGGAWLSCVCPQFTFVVFFSLF